MKALLAVFLLALVGCAKPIPEWPKAWPAEFDDTLNTYLEEARMYGNPVNTETLQSGEGYFVPANSLAAGTVAGQCTRWTRGGAIDKWRIAIDSGVWAASTVGQREQLLTHELGHCINGFEHRGVWNGKRRTSIMFPSMLVDSEYSGQRAAYRAEFWSGVWPLSDKGE